MSDGQAIMSHVGRWLWSLWSSHWVRVTSNMPHRHLKRLPSNHDMSPTTVLAVGGCIRTGATISVCVCVQKIQSYT